MAVATGVPLEEYLHTEYEPDCDFVDGVLEDCNAGYFKHSATLTALIGILHERTRGLGVKVLPILRLRVSPTRIRVIDLCLLANDERAQIPSHPPRLCIEVLDSRDTWTRVQSCNEDYLAFGVPQVWIVDPYEKRAWMVSPGQLQPCDELRWNGVVVQLSEILPE